MPTARLRILGSGTSTGVPMLGCRCRVCTSSDARDRRLRPSILLRFPGPAGQGSVAAQGSGREPNPTAPAGVVIDTTPDFRAQALAAGLERVDGVLYTHGHADHIFGMDDLRQLNFALPGPIPLYGDAGTMADLQRVFRYAFNDDYPHSAIPKIAAHAIAPPATVTVAGIAFEAFSVRHGELPILAYRFGANAYITDFSEIPAAAMGGLRGLDVLILDALRHRPHPTHSTIANSVRLVEELAPRRAFFTHICHDLPHAETEKNLPPNAHLAYDGLELEVEA